MNSKLLSTFEAAVNKVTAHRAELEREAAEHMNQQIEVYKALLDIVARAVETEDSSPLECANGTFRKLPATYQKAIRKSRTPDGGRLLDIITINDNIMILKKKFKTESPIGLLEELKGVNPFTPLVVTELPNSKPEKSEWEKFRARMLAAIKTAGNQEFLTPEESASLQTEIEKRLKAAETRYNDEQARYSDIEAQPLYEAL